MLTAIDYDDFTGHVQEHGDYADTGEAVSAVRATLTTLGERIEENEAGDLAAQLPPEIGRYLTESAEGTGEQFDAETFLDRVAERGEREAATDDPENAAESTMLAVQEALGGEGDLADVISQFPQNEGYGDLFRALD